MWFNVTSHNSIKGLFYENSTTAVPLPSSRGRWEHVASFKPPSQEEQVAHEEP